MTDTACHLRERVLPEVPLSPVGVLIAGGATPDSGLRWRAVLGRRRGVRTGGESAATLARQEAPWPGLNVHATRTLHGADHAQVERLVRYLARPPIAQDRLEQLEDGRVRYRFKRAFKDGSTAVDLEPFDLPARICAIIVLWGLRG